MVANASPIAPRLAYRRSVARRLLCRIGLHRMVREQRTAQTILACWHEAHRCCFCGKTSARFVPMTRVERSVAGLPFSR